MLITYHGHAEFEIQLANGYTIITDPYDAHVGYEMKEYACDAVTVSHGHGDHNFIDKLLGNFVQVDSAGEWHLAPEVKVTAIPSVHDEAGGAKRGKNLIMKLEAEGLTLVHLGDQGDRITQEQLSAMGKVDVLLIPVGGFYTIDAQVAEETVDQLNPRVVIPMHYKTAVNADWPIADEKPFLQRMNAADAHPMPLIRITKGDLDQQPRLALLQYVQPTGQ